MSATLTRVIAAVVVFIVIIFGVTSADAVNLVSDSSFERGGVGWEFLPFFDVANVTSNHAHTGNHAAVLVGFFHDIDARINQTITTMPGHNYLVNLFIEANDSAGGDISVSFADVVGFSQHVLPGSLATGYLAHQFTAAVTSTSSVFQFRGQNFEPGSTFFLDDVSITDLGPAVTSMPEPATWLLLATGCFGLLGYGWWRQRAA